MSDITNTGPCVFSTLMLFGPFPAISKDIKASYGAYLCSALFLLGKKVKYIYRKDKILLLAAPQCVVLCS